MKKNIKKLAEEARHMLKSANLAFQNDDAELANSRLTKEEQPEQEDV